MVVLETNDVEENFDSKRNENMAQMQCNPCRRAASDQNTSMNRKPNSKSLLQLFFSARVRLDMLEGKAPDPNNNLGSTTSIERCTDNYSESGKAMDLGSARLTCRV